MELLLNLGWAFVPQDQMLVRHYFLEQLNKPEYIWGIRAVCVMTAVLVFFLYQKLKENMEVMEAAVSGEAMATDNSSADIDNVPVIEIAFTSKPEPELASVSTFEAKPEPMPENVPVLETVSEAQPEPVSENVLVLETVSEPKPEPMSENVPVLDTVSEPEPEPVPENAPVMEHNIPKRETEIKPVKRLSAAHKVPVLDSESNIWLWALVGVSVSIGGLVALSIYRKKRRVA